jgi:hypothetical protein
MSRCKREGCNVGVYLNEADNELKIVQRMFNERGRHSEQVIFVTLDQLSQFIHWLIQLQEEADAIRLEQAIKPISICTHITEEETARNV